ncbi:MAG: aryl-sulfate sulfotransferase [Prochlorothrix sp.]|nr:aryl-sulfate sulfotransferase [Prochlorothrix sp.]
MVSQQPHHSSLTQPSRILAKSSKLFTLGLVPLLGWTTGLPSRSVLAAEEHRSATSTATHLASPAAGPAAPPTGYPDAPSNPRLATADQPPTPTTHSLRFTHPPTVMPNPNPKVPLAAVLQFEASEPVETIVTVSDGPHTWTLNFGTDHDPKAGLPIIGMRPARHHTITVTIANDTGTVLQATEPLGFTTPALPEDPDVFPPLAVSVSEPEALEPGVTLLSVRRRRPTQGQREVVRFNQSYGLLLAVDDAGEPVWFYQEDSRISDFELLQNGNIAYLTQDYRLVEIDWLGNTVNTFWAQNRPKGPAEGIPIDTTTLHHDVDQMSNGNFIGLGTDRRIIENYYTSETDATAPRATQPVMGDVVLEFDRQGQVLWSWNTFDFLDPFRIGYETFSGYWDRRGFPGTLDWTHSNNVVYDPKDDSILLSSRYLSSILKIDRATGNLEWILGDPAGWEGALADKTFTLTGAAEGETRWFYHQHSPEPSHNGTVLIFDNGNFGTFPFDPPLPLVETRSRAVEYEINEVDRTVTQIWSSEIPGEAPVLSFAMGDVDALPQTDNILLSEGLLLARDQVAELSWEEIAPQANVWTRVREMTRTTPPEVLWEVVMDNGIGPDVVGWILYSSERIALPYQGDDRSVQSEF